jgi:hypothetical protein
MWKGHSPSQEAVNMESRPLPARHDFGHDGRLCTKRTFTSSWKCHQLAAQPWNKEDNMERTWIQTVTLS